MISRDVLTAFKNASWTSTEAVNAWLGALGPVDASDVEKLVEIARSDLDPARSRARAYALAKAAEAVTDRGLFAVYAKALKTAGPEIRGVLATLLPRVFEPRAVDELVAHVGSQDAALRQMALEVLRQIGGKAVFQSLTELVTASGASRPEAIEALVHVAGAHAVPHLQQILAAGKLPEKVAVLKVLADPRLARAASVMSRAIAPLLTDTNEAVAIQAVASFAAVCSEDELFGHLTFAFDSPNHLIVKAAVDGLRRFRSPRVIQLLGRKLQSGPNKIRLAVLQALEAIGNEDILPPLVDALGHKHVSVRGAAGEVFVRLSKSGKLDVAPTIVWLLRSKDVNVRRMAAEIARSVKDPAGDLWPKLVAFIRDEDWWVRESVMDALVAMGGTQIAQHFIAYLTDESDVVRRFAVDVLARLKEKSALPALLKVSANDADWWVRERAVEAIATLRDERTVPHLASLIKRVPDMHLVVLQAIESMNGRAAAPHLGPALASEDAEVRLAAIRCLMVIGDPAQAAMVQPLAADPDLRVQKQAQALLERWQITFSAEHAGGGSADVGVSRLDRFLITAAEAEADDFILEAGNRPFVKRLGKVVPMGSAPLTDDQVRAMLHPRLTVQQIHDLESLKDVDFSYEVKSEGLRFRANVFRHIGGLSAVFRLIKAKVPDLESLGLPDIVKGFGDLPNGLVLVGGPTGSGKSTTLAALIDYVNRTYATHVISLEDPIEVVHSMKKGLVNQREIGTHTRSFGRALRSTLREDPDVILVGEMRDMETIHFAITAADTGHLVFGTVHTVAADTAVDRLINVFPSAEQQQARSSLANSLRAVVCQYLLKRADGNGRVLASEVMLNNDAVSNLIRKGKTFQIPSVIATSREVGMQSMDQDLIRLQKAGVVTKEEAYMKARNKKDFEHLFGAGEKPKLDPKTEGAAPAGPTTGRFVAPGAN